MERAEDVLTHKRLLKLAEESHDLPAFDVRIVQVNQISIVCLVLSFIFFKNLQREEEKNPIKKQGLEYIFFFYSVVIAVKYEALIFITIFKVGICIV